MNDVELFKSGYKNTLLGYLPENWEIVKLGEIFNIKQGKSLSSKKQTGKNSYPFLRTSNIYWDYIDLSHLDVMDFSPSEITELQLEPYDLLVCEGGDIGRTAMWEGQLKDCFYQNHLHRLRNTSGNVFPKFYVYWFQTAFRLFKLYGGTENRTTIPNLSQGRLKEFFVPLPPLPEQRAIAHVLSTVRQAIEATERVIEAARQLKKSMMKHLFTYGPVPIGQADQVLLKETEIGVVPEGWRMVRLENVSNKPQYGFTETAIKERVGPHFLRITDIQNDGSVNWSLVPYCQCTDHEYEKYQLHNGDILVARIGATTGKSFYVAECPSAVFASYLIRIKTDANSLLPKYLFYFMNTHFYWSQIDAIKGGRLKQGVNIPNLQKLLLSLPQLSEQASISSMLDIVNGKIQEENHRKSALEALFISLLHHLMTGKVRVPPEYYPTKGD